MYDYDPCTQEYRYGGRYYDSIEDIEDERNNAADEEMEWERDHGDA